VLSGCIVYFRFFTSTNVQIRTPEEQHTQLSLLVQTYKYGHLRTSIRSSPSVVSSRLRGCVRLSVCSGAQFTRFTRTKVHILTCEGERVLSDAAAMSLDVEALRRGALDKLDALHARLCGTQFTSFTGTKSTCFTR